LAREKLELLFEDRSSDLPPKTTNVLFGAVQAHGDTTITDVADFVIGFLCPLYANRLCGICIWNVFPHSNYSQRYNDKCLISRVIVFTPEF
jgi:hypothetical protein